LNRHFNAVCQEAEAKLNAEAKPVQAQPSKLVPVLQFIVQYRYFRIFDH
jgi:hypothetical protein